MVNSKLKVTIELPGRILYENKEVKEHPELQESNYVTISFVDHKKFKRETIHYLTRKRKPAYQTITMSEDAYKDMINTCPEKIARKDWSQMSKNQRVEKHLELIAQALGGTAFTYNILED